MMDAYKNLKKEIVQKFGTPTAVIDLDIVENNIKSAQKKCDEVGVANRPHIKTHKSSHLAKLQLDFGAHGITCQKIGEAEVMVDAGITDIIVATNVIGAARSGRLSRLLKRAPVRCCADSSHTLKLYSMAAEEALRPLDVLIECDTGLERAGVETPSEAFELVKIIKSDPWLEFAGLLFYPPVDCWRTTQVFLDEAVRRISLLGLSVNIVSTGGTPNFKQLGQLNGATEHRAGTCIFNDRMMISAGVATQADCAFTIFTSVVSRSGENRGILDAGSKTFSYDSGNLDGYGLILEYPDAQITKFAEEHGFVDLSQSKCKPEVGTVCRVIPNHVCVVVNLFSQLVGVRNGKVIGIFPVEARGMLV